MLKRRLVVVKMNQRMKILLLSSLKRRRLVMVPLAPVAATDTYLDIAMDANHSTTLSDVLAKAALHIKQADDQRRLCNEIISEAAEEDYKLHYKYATYMG
jgi:hypothetical protein